MRRFVNKRRIMLYLLFVIILTTSCTSKKLDEQIQAYQEAHNSGNVKKELSFMAEDIKYFLVDGGKIEGKKELRKLVEMDAVLHSNLIFTDVKVSNNTVKCSAEEQNDFLKLAGIDTIYYEYREFVFEKGLIKEIRIKVAEKSTNALREFGKSFMVWAAKNRKEELTALQDKGLMTIDNVDGWLVLMRAWREEMDKEEQQEKSEKDVEKLDLLKVPSDSKIDANSMTKR